MDKSCSRNQDHPSEPCGQTVFKKAGLLKRCRCQMAIGDGIDPRPCLRRAPASSRACGTPDEEDADEARRVPGGEVVASSLSLPTCCCW